MQTHALRASYIWLTCLLALVGCSDAPEPGRALEGKGGGLGTAPPTLKTRYTEHVGQLTNTLVNPIEPLGFVGTDLGITFQRGDSLYFLFGDSWMNPWFNPDFTLHPELNWDTIAKTSVARPATVPTLKWFTRDGSRFLPFTLEGHPMGTMSVPVEGISVDNLTYLFFYVTPFITDENGEEIAQPPISVLAVADALATKNEGFDSLQILHETADTHFLSVSTVQVGETLYIYGADHYRTGTVYLAQTDIRTLADRSSWKYYAGLGVKPADYDKDAAPLFDENCVGELSVRKHPTRQLYFMTYNCSTLVKDEKTGAMVDGYPHEIRLRTATNPEGPWSEPEIIFKKGEGDGHFVHGPGPDDDGLADPYFPFGPGDVYGPYMIPQWFSDPEPGVYEIMYTLSSWNPYQVHLMKTVLAETNDSTDESQ